MFLFLFLLFYYYLFYFKKIAISHSENFANIAKISLCEIFAIIAKFRYDSEIFDMIAKIFATPTVLHTVFVSLITFSSELRFRRSRNCLKA